MMLGVVRHVPSALAVRAEFGRFDLGSAESAHELAQVNDILGSLGQSDDLRLARGEGDGFLLPRTPDEGGDLPEHDPPRSGVSSLPRGVCVAVEASHVGSVDKPEVRGASEVGQYVVGFANELGRGLCKHLQS
jgi:hypothetical protein